MCDTLNYIYGRALILQAFIKIIENLSISFFLLLVGVQGGNNVIIIFYVKQIKLIFTISSLLNDYLIFLEWLSAVPVSVITNSTTKKWRLAEKPSNYRLKTNSRNSNAARTRIKGSPREWNCHSWLRCGKQPWGWHPGCPGRSKARGSGCWVGVSCWACPQGLSQNTSALGEKLSSSWRVGGYHRPEGKLFALLLEVLLVFFLLLIRVTWSSSWMVLSWHMYADQQSKGDCITHCWR